MAERIHNPYAIGFEAGRKASYSHPGDFVDKAEFFILRARGMCDTDGEANYNIGFAKGLLLAGQIEFGSECLASAIRTHPTFYGRTLSMGDLMDYAPNQTFVRVIEPDWLGEGEG